MNLRNQTIENQTIVLRSGETTGLGPSAVLRRCRVECHVTARELVLTDVEMHHCTFVAKKQLTGYKFLEARFYDCAFEGTYSGCDFGKRAGAYDNLGDIARCDFNKARLDACRFFNCDVDSLNLNTKRPNLLFVRPQVQLASIDPGPMTTALDIYFRVTRDQSPECDAVVDDVELTAKRVRVDPHELAHFAERIGARSRPS
jgi:hypothetical protein